MTEKEIQLLPFFVEECQTHITSKHCDLTKPRAILRGMQCTKTKLPANIPVYQNGNLIEDEIFYWQQDGNKETVFDIGLELLNNTKARKKVHPSLRKFMKK